MPGVGVVNLGADGYGLDQSYLGFLDRAGEPPSGLVILAVTRASVEALANAERGGWPKPRLVSEGGALRAMDAPLPDRSAAGAWWRRKLEPLRQMRLPTALRRGGNVAEVVRPPDPRLEDARLSPLVKGIVGEVDRLVRRDGSRLAMVYLPSPADLASPRRHWARGVLGREARRLGRPFLDLTDPLRAADPRGRTLFDPSPDPSAAAYTPAGHALVADFIQRELPAWFSHRVP
jgi:hypothetical protein